MGVQLSHRHELQPTLALSASMRHALNLLHLGPDDALAMLATEARRNPFLRILPPAPISGAEPQTHALPYNDNPTENLLRQIGVLRLSPADRLLAENLVHCIDERGFLTDPPEHMSAYLGVSRERLTTLVATLQQSVEPAGVFAWSLAECFRLQLQARNRYDSLIAALLQRLDLVAKRDIVGICALCGVDAEDAGEMIADIRALRPSPLTPVAAPARPAGEPELIVRQQPDGGLRVELNPAALPSILVDDGLFSHVQTVELDGAARRYYRDCHRTAAGLALALQKRANTLLRIGQELATAQANFLVSGRALDRAPLSMAMLAARLSLNKSTISRALNECRIATPHGIRAAADYLTRGVNAASGDRSREQALQRLSVLLRAEDPRAPLSDAILSRLLCHAGFAVTARTVTKYRHHLGIGTANRRQQQASASIDCSA